MVDNKQNIKILKYLFIL